MNVLVLAARDRETGSLSAETRLSASIISGSCSSPRARSRAAGPGLNFHYEPWEADDGATMA